MRRGRSAAWLAAAAAVSICLWAAPSAAFNVEAEIEGRYGDAKLAADRACLASLEARASEAQIPELRINTGTRADLRLQITSTGQSSFMRSAIMIAHVPHLFRDAAHFHAFTQSDLFQRLKQADHGLEPPELWLAVAYGGFYHLFSRARAFTEPKHFYEQRVRGARQAALYERFKANEFLRHDVPFMSNHDEVRRAAENLASDEKYVRVDAVEATLLQAPDNRLETRARFVNLTFSAIYPVFFLAEVRREWDALPGSLRERLQRWIQSAAEDCSRANYREEQRILAQLRQSGLTIVPVNRSAFVEAGWSWAMTRLVAPPRESRYWGTESSFWSVGDLDEIVRMGAKSPPKPLPSAVAAKLAQKEQRALRAHAKQVADVRKAALNRSQVASTAHSLQDDIRIRWRTDVVTLADQLRDRIDDAAAVPAKRTSVGSRLCKDSAAVDDFAKVALAGYVRDELAEADRPELTDETNRINSAADARAVVGMLANAIEGRKPGHLIFILSNTLAGTSNIQPFLAGRAATLYQQLAEVELPLDLKSGGRVSWPDWDWLDAIQSAALLWAWADNPDAVRALKQELGRQQAAGQRPAETAQQRLANSVRRERFNTTHATIDRALAAIYLRRGDLAASRAADGGRYAADLGCQ